MIELTILRALLLDDEDLALEATKNYGVWHEDEDKV